MKNTFGKRMAATFCASTFIFCLSVGSAGATSDSSLKEQTKSLISAQNITSADNLQFEEVFGDLGFLTQQGFAADKLSIAQVQYDGSVVYAFASDAGMEKDIIVTQDSNGTRSGFYKTQSIYVPSGTKISDYTGTPSLYLNTKLQQAQSTIISIGVGGLVTLLTGGFASAGLALAKDVARSIASGVIGSLAANALDDSATFTDYRIAHSQNDKSLVRYFKHNVTTTTSRGTVVPDNYYEIWEPI